MPIIPIPPLREQYEIVRHIEKALDTINSIFTHKQAILEELNQLDRSILAKACRGELVPQDLGRRTRSSITRSNSCRTRAN
jgi:type I restriction enzyme, S subunit